MASHIGARRPAPAPAPARLPCPQGAAGVRRTARRAGLASDKALGDDEMCLPIIREYAQDQGRFFADFAAAYRKMGQQGVLPPSA